MRTRWATKILGKLKHALPLAVLLILSMGRADVRGCACDVAKPETMAARECALCREAEPQPPEPRFFFVQDANPTTPNREEICQRQNNPQRARDFPGHCSHYRVAGAPASPSGNCSTWCSQMAVGGRSMTVPNQIRSIPQCIGTCAEQIGGFGLPASRGDPHRNAVRA